MRDTVGGFCGTMIRKVPLRKISAEPKLRPDLNEPSCEEKSAVLAIKLGFSLKAGLYGNEYSYPPIRYNVRAFYHASVSLLDPNRFFTDRLM